MKQKETVNPDDVEVTIPTAEPDGTEVGRGRAWSHRQSRGSASSC